MTVRKTRVARPGMKAIRVGTPVVRLDWAEESLCHSTGPFLFDEVPATRSPSDEATHKTVAYRKAEKRRAGAKKICQVCPVFDECATHVMSVGETYGVWAGLSAKQRKRIMNTHVSLVDRLARVRAIVFATPVVFGELTLEQMRGIRMRRSAAEAALLAAEEATIDASIESEREALAAMATEIEEPSMPSSDNVTMAQAS